MFSNTCNSDYLLCKILKLFRIYIKKNFIAFYSSLSPIASNWTPSDSNDGIASSSRSLETAETHIEVKT